MLEKLLVRKQKTMSIGSRDRTWDVYTLSPSGWDVLRQHAKQRASSQHRIFIQPPEALIEMEQEAQRKVQERLEQDKANGIDLSIVPQEELMCGTGTVLAALRQWNGKQTWRRSIGKNDLADRFESLLNRILQWRDKTAQILGMAPANVIRTDLVWKIAYSLPRTVEDLHSIGVRVRGVENLSELLSNSITELKLAAATSPAAGYSKGARLIFPQGICQSRSEPQFQSAAKARLPPWRTRYDLFHNSRMTPAAIATTGTKSVLVSTVVQGIVSALVAGSPVDLRRLWSEATPEHTHLDGAAWEELEKVQIALGVNVNQDSSWKGLRFLCGDPILRSVNDGELCPMLALDFKDRSEDQARTLRKWRAAISLWALIKRARIDVRVERSE